MSTSIKNRFTLFHSHHQVHHDSNSLPQLYVVATAHLTARFSQSNYVHRAVSFNSFQLCDGRGAGAVVFTIRMEAEEQETRKLPAALHCLSGNIQSAPCSPLPEMRSLRREDGKEQSHFK